MNAIAADKLSDEQVVIFFRKLKNELNCPSTERTITQVRRVLSKISGNYSAPQMTELVNKTPPLLHLLLISNCRFEERMDPVNHLDELADSVYREDQQTGKRLFRSEIEALGSVIVILKGLQSLFLLAGMRALSYVLSNELQQAVIGEAF